MTRKKEKGVLRCKVCFNFYLVKKPHLTRMSSFEIKLFSKANSLSTGIVYEKSKCRDMMTGGNGNWYHLKSTLINIGHSRKNFNNILYCLENSINKHVAEWLDTPLPSTGLPPHFWSTVDKATPSRATNQAVVIVARDAECNVCPIPVAAPEECEAASYDELGTQMIEAIRENYSPEILSR